LFLPIHKTEGLTRGARKVFEAFTQVQFDILLQDFSGLLMIKRLPKNTSVELMAFEVALRP
jgi:hypothetical protein